MSTAFTDPKTTLCNLPLNPVGHPATQILTGFSFGEKWLIFVCNNTTICFCPTSLSAGYIHGSNYSKQEVPSPSLVWKWNDVWVVIIVNLVELKRLWVRSFSFPGSTPVCGVFFFQDERVQIITHVRPGKKNRHTPGSTQGS